MGRLLALALLFSLAPAACAQEDARAHYNRGVGLANGGQLEAAAEAFRQAIAADPSLALAHYNLGIAMQQLKRHPEALAAFRESARLDPSHAPSHMNLGATHQAMGNPDEAVTAYREAARLRPDDPEAQFGLCWMLLAGGQREEAAREYAALARLSQSRADALYTDYKAMPGTAPEPASAAVEPPVAPVQLSYATTPGDPVRYRATEKTTALAGSTRSVTVREIVYTVQVKGKLEGRDLRETTLESERVTLDGRQVEPPAHGYKTGLATRTQFGANGETFASFIGAEPALCRPVFPAAGPSPGSSWTHATRPLPGSFPSVPIEWTCTLDRVAPVDGATCARITMKGANAAGGTRWLAVLLWDVEARRLHKLRAKGLTESAGRKLSQELAVDRLP